MKLTIADIAALIEFLRTDGPTLIAEARSLVWLIEDLFHGKQPSPDQQAVVDRVTALRAMSLSRGE